MVRSQFCQSSEHFCKEELLKSRSRLEPQGVVVDLRQLANCELQRVILVTVIPCVQLFGFAPRLPDQTTGCCHPPHIRVRAVICSNRCVPVTGVIGATGSKGRGSSLK